MPANNIAQLLQMLSGPSQPKRQGFDPRVMADESIDPSVRADMGNSAMQSELRDRRFQARRTVGPGPNSTNPNEVAALTELLGGYDAERSNPQNPLNMQRAEIDNTRELNTSAMNAGFTGDQTGSGSAYTPAQQREIYKRKMDEEKMRQPIQERGMMEQGLNQRQQAQIGATQKMVETQMEPSNRYAELQQDIYSGAGGGGIDPANLKSVGKNNMTFQNRPNVPSQIPLQRDLQRARELLGSTGIQDPWADPLAATPEQQNFMQTARSIVYGSKLDSASASELFEWLQNPDDQSFDEAFPMPQVDRTDPSNYVTQQKNLQDWEEARRLALLLRGSL